MADNTLLNSGSGGDTLRTEDRTTYKTPVSLIDVGGVSAEALIGDAGNYMPCEGAAAENAAAAGNPVLVGARYDATPRTLGDGDVGAIALDADGAVQISDGGNDISVDWSGTAPPIGAGVEATALRVTVATDSTGVLSVDDNGASLTVDNADITTIAGAVSGSEMQVDVVAALPTGANTIGDVTVSGDALTALQLIDDVVATLGTDTYLEATTKGAVIGAVRNDTLATLANTDNEIAPLQVNANGSLYCILNDASLNAIEIIGLAGTNGLGVAVVDTSGNQVSTFTNTELNAGTTVGANNGILAMVMRDDALTTLTDLEGEANYLRVGSTGALWVQHEGDITIADGGNDISIDWAGTAPPIGAGTEAAALRVTIATDSTGVVSVDDNGAALTVDNGGTFNVQDKPDTSGGLSQSKTISAATTNATSVKGSAGQVYAVQVFNTNASPRYLKLYNKATAPTVGTDTPVKTLLIPGNSNGAGMVLNWDKGLEFTLGIGFALTTGITDADTGAVAANEIAVNLDYN